jgi:hypothetical protein
MNFSKTIIVASLSLGAFYTQASVELFSDSHFGGKRTVLFGSNSIKNTKDEIGMHDSISSLKVGPGECAVLFENHSYTGTTKFFGQGEHSDLRNEGFNDETSSIHVFPSYYCDANDLTYFHRHAPYGDIKFAVAKGNSDGLSSYWNDEISSITVGRDSCAIVFKHGSYQGTVHEFKESVATLSTWSFNDKISSYQIVEASSCNNPTEGGGSGGGGGGGGGGSQVQY